MPPTANRRPSHLNNTPSWNELMAHPEWKTFLRTPGYLPPALRQPGMKPWVLWILFRQPDPEGPQPEFTWGRLDTATYVEAFNAWVKLRKGRPNAVDWAISCKPKLYTPPAKLLPLIHAHKNCVWCPRCRRPVELVWTRKHHALRAVEVLCTEPALRCPYCGIRGGRNNGTFA